MINFCVDKPRASLRIKEVHSAKDIEFFSLSATSHYRNSKKISLDDTVAIDIRLSGLQRISTKFY